MTWFKVDDKLWGHPKWLRTPLRARGLWVSAGSWCATHETDGHVPRHVVKALGGTPRDANDLVLSSLWSKAEDGWNFHDWACWQPTSEALEQARDQAKHRMRAARFARSSQHVRANTERSSQHVRSTPTRPVNPPTPLPATAHPPAGDGSSADADGDDAFNEFWNTYPKPVSKPKTRAAWQLATHLTTPHHILTALQNQLPTLQQTPHEYRPGSLTWLRDQRWLDKPAEEETDPWAHLPHLNPRPDNWKDGQE